MVNNFMNLTVYPTIKDKKILDIKSPYIGTEDILKRQVLVMDDYKIAQDFRDTNWVEFNDNDLLQRASKDQEMFNGNTPDASGDPNESWKANTVNPMVRNRCISIMAHLIQSYLYPSIIAQNEQSEEDKEASIVFSDMVEWALEEGHYSEKMMNMLYAFVSEPIVCVKLDYVNATRKIKVDLEEEKDSKKWEWQTIKDEKLSGFQIDVIPYDEIYFGNVHEIDIQKQPFIITRKKIDYSEAKNIYGDLSNWKYISPGLVTFFAKDEDAFYEKNDGELESHQVYRDTYYNRTLDLELEYISGVLIHNDPERPLQRTDKLYPIAETGYELIHNRFIYKKCLVSKLAATQIDLNDLWNAVKDMARYQATPATFSYGFDEMDSSVTIPGMNTNTTSKEAGISPINNGSELSGAMNVIKLLQGAQFDSSQSPLQSGQQEKGQQTKYEIQRLEMNAQTVLGLSGEMLAHLVKQIGELALGLVLQHIPITEIGEITDSDALIKMMPIIIPNRSVDGETMSRKIDFTTNMPANDEDEMNKSFELLNEESEKEMSIIKMNPDIMTRLKFLVKVVPTFMDRATKISKMISAYDKLLQNPMYIQNPKLLEAVTKDLLLAQIVPGEEYKYLPSAEQPIEETAKRMFENESTDKSTDKPINKPSKEDNNKEI